MQSVTLTKLDEVQHDPKSSFQTWEEKKGRKKNQGNIDAGDMQAKDQRTCSMTMRSFSAGSPRNDSLDSAPFCSRRLELCDL